MCVRNSPVYGPLTLDANASQRLLGDQVCQEFIRRVLPRSRRGSPPSAGIMYNSLSGCSSIKLLALQNTIHLPSGEYLAK